MKVEQNWIFAKFRYANIKFTVADMHILSHIIAEKHQASPLVQLIYYYAYFYYGGPLAY